MGREGGQSRASHTQGPGSCPKGLWEIPSPGLTKLERNVEAAPAGDMRGRSSPGLCSGRGASPRRPSPSKFLSPSAPLTPSRCRTRVAVSLPPEVPLRALWPSCTLCMHPKCRICGLPVPAISGPLQKTCYSAKVCLGWTHLPAGKGLLDSIVSSSFQNGKTGTQKG